jgi:hypothetical protein
VLVLLDEAVGLLKPLLPCSHRMHFCKCPIVYDLIDCVWSI